MITFRHNGILYNQSYAWVPTQVTSGSWIWFAPYYSREVKGQGWVSMTPFEFWLDSTKD
jgi:hypothetical protein